MVRLEKIQSEFWDYQATVSEEGIIAKIMRVIERPPSIKIELLTDDEHDTLNTYESIGFFKSAVYPKIMVAIPVGPSPMAMRGEMRVIGTKPEADIAWHKVGQAQLWYSTTSKVCVLWECLAFGDMKPRAKEFWEWTLKYCESLEMEEIYTHDRDPAYDDNYKSFLESLGFELVRERTMRRCCPRNR
jgi:hypothetical protein